MTNIAVKNSPIIWMQFDTGTSYNLIPRVLSSVGRVGENPGNEVVQVIEATNGFSIQIINSWMES